MQTDLGVTAGFYAPEYLVAGAQRIEVSIVIPTFNERENLPVLIEKLQDVMAGRGYENHRRG